MFPYVICVRVMIIAYRKSLIHLMNVLKIQELRLVYNFLSFFCLKILFIKIDIYITFVEKIIKFSYLFG